MAKKPKKNPEQAQKTRDRIKKWDDQWRFNRTQYHEWMDFVMGNMWKEDESKVFTRYNKIPLVMNKLSPLASYMMGEQRQNTPSLEVSPTENAPLELVEIRKALVDNIMTDSHSSIAFQSAFFSAVIGGYGAFGGDTKYENEHSFHQDIDTVMIKDPTRCYWDVMAESPCKTDGMYCGNRTRMSRQMFRAKYGKKLEQSIPSSSATEDTSLMSFSDDDTITIVDDYERKYDTVKIYQLSDSDKVIEQSVLDDMERIDVDGKELLMNNGQIVSIENEREAYRYSVIHRQIAGDFILEEEDFPSEQLPIIFVDQSSYWDKNGKQICRPFFKDAQDAQRYLNYLATQSAYLMKVSRYDQFIVSKANVKSPDTQAIWRDPATQQGGLVYDESPNGNKPEQLRPAELPMSLINQYERTLRDIETSTGIYGTQLGQQGNETSGAAVDARTTQGSYNTYVAYDSINRAIACYGEIVNEMIPKVYDAERLMMLKMGDQQVKPITINKSDVYGAQTENDMTTGRYKIRLLPGPNHEGQKKEARESMEMMMRADPSIFALIGDLYAENLPINNNIELRNRIRTIINPEIIEAGKTGKPIPPKPQQEDPMIAIKKQELQIKMLSEQNKLQVEQMKAQAKMQEIQTKQAEIQMKVHNEGVKVSLEYQSLEAEKLEAAAKLQEQELRYESEMKRIQADIDLSHADNISKLLIHAGQIHHEKDIQHKEHKFQASQPKPTINKE